MSHWVDNQRMTIQPMIVNGKWRWVNSRPFRFVLGPDSIEGAVIDVPAGFDSDLGSIPWWARWLISPSDPDCAQAYMLHDWMNKLTAGRPPQMGVWSSQAAAAILYDALRCNDVPVWKAKLIFFAVCLGIAKKEW